MPSQEKTSVSLLTVDLQENNVQSLYDDRRKALFEFILRGPAAECFDSLEAVIAWNEMKTQLIAQFTDGKMQYRFRIEGENLKRQLKGNTKIYIHRIKTLVDKGGPAPSDADAGKQTACKTHPSRKYKDFFILGLTPTGFKQKLTRR